jgi:translation initiation factor 1
MTNSRLVYSTETGRICSQCGHPKTACRCKKKKISVSGQKPDGIIRIQREKKGRKGKTVNIISGFTSNDAELKKLASQLKNRCGCGGSAKDGVIIIQGDHRDTLLAELKKQGFTVKLAGG